MVVRVAAVKWAPAVRVNGVAPAVTDRPMLGRGPRDGGWLPDRPYRSPAARGHSDDIAGAILAEHEMPGNWSDHPETAASRSTARSTRWLRASAKRPRHAE